MTLDNFEISVPKLRTDWPMVRLSTDGAPTVDDEGGPLQVGQELLYDDIGKQLYYDGTTWKPVTLLQRICQLIDIQREIRDALTQGD